MKEELLERAVKLRKESGEIENQLEFVKNQISDLEQFRAGLDFIQKNKDEKIFSPLSRGVFVEAEMKHNNKILVDVGAGVFIKKSSGSKTTLLP